MTSNVAIVPTPDASAPSTAAAASKISEAKESEEKAAHLLYFMVKNHPFVDGNKRSGALAFVWFLKKARRLNIARLTPEALTALTLLVAESNSKDKERMIGLILLLLKK